MGAGAYVGWNIGANDTANCVGTTVRCGLLSFKKAVILVSVFAILGAMLQGQYVMETIGKAEALNGKLLIQPSKEIRENPLAIIADPSGAVFGIQQIRDLETAGGDQP